MNDLYIRTRDSFSMTKCSLFMPILLITHILTTLNLLSYPKVLLLSTSLHSLPPFSPLPSPPRLICSTTLIHLTFTHFSDLSLSLQEGCPGFPYIWPSATSMFSYGTVNILYHGIITQLHGVKEFLFIFFVSLSRF